MTHHDRARRCGTHAPLCLAIATALTFCAGADAATLRSPDIARSRAVLSAGDYPAAEAGVELLHDYGAFRLYRLDAAHVARIGAGARAIAANTVEFNSLSLDTAAATVAIPDAFRAHENLGTTLRLVQFPGPIAPEWIDALTQSGAHIVQYIPNNAYVVLADEAATHALDERAASGDLIQYSGPYAPYYKLGTSLVQRVNRGLVTGQRVGLAVQVVSWSGNAASKAIVEQIAGQGARGAWEDLAGVEVMKFDATEGDIARLAQLDDVFAVEEYVEPHKMDEVQNQIVAGNLASGNAGPSGPGYLAWLAGLGFPTDPAQYPIVDIADDGIGNGSAANGAGDPILTLNGNGTTTRLAAVFNCTSDASADGRAGHGHLNTGIVGGYDQRSGTPYVDPLGYRRGLGINPYARLAHTKIFRNSGSWSLTHCTGSSAGPIQQQVTNGAQISSNSWGASTGGAYDSDARAYDIATRDASTSTSGNQPMIYIFAAGNDGSGSATVGSPGTAKNVITVGASENKRQTDESGTWTDGCGIGSTGADNAMDVISFSSRGPARGGRKKPEVIAPGTHVQSTASTASGYDGTGVCDQYRPNGQTIFAASSGTSHSTPAVAGMSSLVYYWLRTRYADTAPGAAMIKAYLMAHPTYLTGVSANDTLPSNAQGYGMPNLGNAFDTTTQRIVEDQTTTFGATGQTWTWSGNVADTGKPLRIALAWSDAAGATTGNPQVNNLDLTVVVNGTTYKGNVFSGQWSTSGGSADTADNYEAVFLPAGTSGTVAVTVTATNIAGDGVPGNADTTDQDFAFVCANCTTGAANTPPVANNDAYSTGEDTPLTIAAAGVLANDTDADGDTLTANLAGNAAHGTVSLNANGSFTYTPSLNYNGSDSFTYTADDGHGGTSNTATVNLTVNAVNDAPIAIADAYSTDQDTTLNVAAPGVLANDGDPDGDTLTVQAVTTPAHGTLTLNANGSFSYVPASGYSGSDAFTYKANDGAADSNTATVSLTVNAVNHDPVANADAYSTSEDTALTVPASGVLGNDTDADGDTLTATLVGNVAHGTLALAANGGFTYTPAANYNGGDAFTYTVSDGHGGTSGTATVTLTVNAVNDAPVANADAYSTSEDTALTVPASGVLGNDTDADGDTLTATLVGNVAHGTLALAANGGFTYTPAANYNGGDAFTYTVSDGHGGTSGTATVTLIVAAVNDAPVANADAYSTSEDTTLTVPAPGVLGNDTDADGDTLTATLVGNVAHGTLALAANGGFTYAPAANYNGSDGFTYTVSDGHGGTSGTATVTLIVAAVNDTPSAAADSIAVIQGGTATTLIGGGTSVLANDSDVDGDTLAAQVVTTPAHGTLTLNANGTFSYHHDGSAAASDSFAYKACDPSNACANATVSITIDLLPTVGCTLRVQTLHVGEATSLSYAGVFTDPEGQALAYSASGAPASLTMNASSGLLSGTPVAGDVDGSPYDVVVGAQDAGGASASTTVRLIVLGANDPIFGNGFDDPSTPPAICQP